MLADNCRRKGTRGRLGSVLSQFLHDLLPQDVHERCNDKAFVSGPLLQLQVTAAPSSVLSDPAIVSFESGLDAMHTGCRDKSMAETTGGAHISVPLEGGSHRSSTHQLPHSLVIIFNAHVWWLHCVHANRLQCAMQAEWPC